MKYKVILQKMGTEKAECVQYTIKTSDGILPLNDYLGADFCLQFTRQINCLSCGNYTEKSWGQGHCKRCYFSLASCDQCQVRPEICAYMQGQCREPAWGLQNCFIPHTVYLANSSGLKVGITRTRTQMHRWMDQGAIQALPLFQVQDRLQAGQLEVFLKQQYADRTDWRALLRGPAPALDLIAARSKVWQQLPPELAHISQSHGNLENFVYPILHYPEKVQSLDLLKTPKISGKLQGIKGQYLLMENSSINIRKHGGFCAELELE